MMATMAYQHLISSSAQEQQQQPISTLLQETIPNRVVRRVSYDSLHADAVVEQTAQALREIDYNLSVISDDDDNDSFYIHKRKLERSSPASSHPEKKRQRTIMSSTTRKQRLPSKMLRFAEEAVVIPSNSNCYSSSSNNVCWYTRSELSAMKSSCKRLALQSTPALKQELFTLHNNTASIPCSTTTTTFFSDEFQYRRGLERWSSALHYQSRAMDILESKSAVFLQQSAAVIRKDGGSNNNNCTTTTQEQIAAAYRKTTVKAKKFARALALADVTEAL